jgi:hypothetical protein
LKFLAQEGKNFEEFEKRDSKKDEGLFWERLTEK